MRILLVTIFVLLAVGSLACVCDSPGPVTSLASAEFVAKAKIIKVVPYWKDVSYEEVTIAPMEIFKGQYTTKLFVPHRNSSCAMEVAENSTWLIYANRQSDGMLSFHYCTRSYQVDRVMDTVRYPDVGKIHRLETSLELQLLAYLQKQKLQPANTSGLNSHYYRTLYPSETMPQAQIAIYRLTVEMDLSVSKIETLKSFESQEITSRVARHLQRTPNFINREKKIPQPVVIIVPMVYYPRDKRNINGHIGVFN